MPNAFVSVSPVALDVKPPPPVAYEPASSLENAQTILANQTKQQMLGRESSLQDVQFRNQLISNAATRALDSDSWDAAMQDAVKRGAPEAGQFIGRYSPVLQERLVGAYGGGGTGSGTPAASSLAASGATPPDVLDRMYQNATPQQMAAILQRTNTMLQILPTVHDQTSYDRAVATLVNAGMPNAAALRGPYSPLTVINLYNKAMQNAAYLQNRVANAAAGQPAPLVKNDVQNVNGRLYSVNPYDATATALTPSKKEFVGIDKTGTMAAGIFEPDTGKFTDISGQAGASPFTAFAAMMDKGESGGVATAKNPRSSATGAGQFIDSTWLDTIKTARPDLVKGLSDKEILGLRNDPKLSEEMTASYAEANAAKLSASGLPVTTATLALAHRFGPSGAEAILKAAPNTRLTEILPKNVIDANPQLARLTAGQYGQAMVSQFGNTSMEAGATSTVPEDVHGADFLKTLSPTIGAQVKAYADGRQPLPTGFALRSPYFQNMLRMITQYDPTFDAVNYNARAKTRSDFTSGKSAVTINALNTALGHLNLLDQAADALHNRDIPAWNYVANAYGTATGQPAPKNFNAIAGLVAEELTRVYRGAGGAEADIRRHMGDIGVNSSPEQVRGALYSIAELLKSKLDAMGEQYNQGMGTTEDPLRLLNGPAQTSFNRLLSYGSEGTGKPNAASRPEGGTLVKPSESFVKGRIYRDAVSGALARFDGPGKWTPVPAGRQ